MPRLIPVILLLVFCLIPKTFSAESISPLEKEHTLGTLIMQQLYGQECVVADPSINDYLQKLGSRLAQNADVKDYKLHVFGVTSDELNAFAFFGGHIAVHTGLIQQARNESELASVLAHETAHIAQKHLPRMMAQNQKQLPLTIAQVLAATAIGMLGAGDAGTHLATAALANHVQQLINYTHAHEQEADRIGMQILVKAQFNPHAMATMFELLQQKSFYEDKSYIYLRTHPLLESRIADVENRAARLPYHPVPDSLMFHLVRAKLELFKKERDADRVKRLKAQLMNGQPPNRTAAEYAYALALAKNNRFLDAIQHLRTLSSLHWMIDLSLAETEYAAGNTQNALSSLKHLIQIQPNHPPLILSYTTMLLELNQASGIAEAEKLLLNLLAGQRAYPANPDIYELLARAQSKMKKHIACHQSQAEFHAARGEFQKAIQQLNFASEKVGKNATLANTIQARKLSLKELMKQQKGID